MARRIRLEDIARKAKLSSSATSKALNGCPGVSEATRDLVLRISREMGYRVKSHEAAAKLAARRMALVRVEPFVDDPSVSHWTSAFVTAARKHGLRLELDDIARQDDAAAGQTLRQLVREVGGLMVFGYLKAGLVRQVEALRLPVVIVGDIASGDSDGLWQVSTDAMGMGTYATEALLAAGHRRVGFFSPEPLRSGWFDRWLSGYQLAMWRSRGGFDARCVTQISRGDIYQIGRAAAAHMLSLAKPPTAYVVPEPQMAWSFRHAMAAHGVELGPDRLVIGGEPAQARDQNLGDYPLLSENTAEGASQAVRMLSERMQGQPAEPVRLVVPFLRQNMDVLVKSSGAAG